MNKIMRILSIILMAAMLVSTISTISMATSVDPGKIAGDLTGKINSEAQGQVTDIGNQIIGILTTVGVVVAVVVLLILGIKYMMGSASEKAEYKKTMIPYIVGAVLIFAGTSLVRVIYSLSTSVSTK